jgi:hypothetical protein
MTYLALHDADDAALLVLDADGSGEGPFIVTKVDLGAVDVNEDTEPNPAGDGIRDYTSTLGAAPVTVELTAKGDATAGPQAWLGRLRGLCHPRRRLYLHVGIDEWPDTRRVLVRGMPAPRDVTDPTPDAQFQWKAPLGYLESVTVSSVTLNPVGLTMPGLAEPISFPVAFPAGNPDGGAPFVAGGDVPTSPTIDIYGPCAGPTIENDLGELIAFKPGFTIPAGHFVRVQPQGPAGLPLVAYDGDTAQQQYGQLDFTQTTPDLGLMLDPGDNRLSFTAQSPGPGCQAVVSWRTRY